MNPSVDARKTIEVPLPACTRVVQVFTYVRWAKSDDWRMTFHLAPLDEKACKSYVRPPFKAAWFEGDSGVVLPVENGGGWHPSIVQARDGRLWTAYNDVGEYGVYPASRRGDDSNIWLTTSKDGRHWARPDRLPINSTGTEYCPSLAASPDGRVWLVWVSDRGGDGKHRPWIASTRDGVRWTQPRRVQVGGEWDMLGLPNLSVINRHNIATLRENPDRGCDFVRFNFDPKALSPEQQALLVAWAQAGHNRILLVGEEIRTYATLFGQSAIGTPRLINAARDREDYEEMLRQGRLNVEYSALSEHPVSTGCRDIEWGYDGIRGMHNVYCLERSDPDTFQSLVTVAWDPSKVLCGSVPDGSNTISFFNAGRGPDARRWTSRSGHRVKRGNDVREGDIVYGYVYAHGYVNGKEDLHAMRQRLNVRVSARVRIPAIPRFSAARVTVTIPSSSLAQPGGDPLTHACNLDVFSPLPQRLFAAQPRGRLTDHWRRNLTCRRVANKLGRHGTDGADSLDG